MKISAQDVLHVANLARLQLDAESLKTYSQQLDAVLSYMDLLNEVDTSDVAPTSHAIALTNAFRDDQPAAQLSRREGLANAPQAEEGCFLVPKVIE
jgi:aspartyl-tRNA(Asn)/glutamyl-tRNA(Gln) amidotransferase subunit C